MPSYNSPSIDAIAPPHSSIFHIITTVRSCLSITPLEPQPSRAVHASSCDFICRHQTSWTPSQQREQPAWQTPRAPLSLPPKLSTMLSTSLSAGAGDRWRCAAGDWRCCGAAVPLVWTGGELVRCWCKCLMRHCGTSAGMT